MDSWNRRLMVLAVVFWLALVGAAGAFLIYRPPW
jgi:hypothetical protein